MEAPHYNESLLHDAQRDRIDVVLVAPRNPLNIGAAARAMANFGFSRLTVVGPYAPPWREARSAVGAPELLAAATEKATLAAAVAGCTLVVGTGTLTHRRPEQVVVSLPHLAPLVEGEIEHGGRVALVFGPETHGLTREDLSWCHLLVEIPTDPRQPSMNLGQAVAVCLYELASRAVQPERVEPEVAAGRSKERGQVSSEAPKEDPSGNAGVKTSAYQPGDDSAGPNVGIETPACQPVPCSESSVCAAHSDELDRLAGLIEETMIAAGYSPSAMQAANRHDLRLMLRRLAPTNPDTRRILGLFRRILWRLNRAARSASLKRDSAGMDSTKG